MRRRVFLGAAAATVGAMTAPMLFDTPAAAANGRTTIILSPHQDDEFIRLGAYIPRASERGDQLCLIQATDGGATAVGRTLSLDRPTLTRWRNREQLSAWEWLTEGRGEHPVYAGLPDGQATVAGLLPAVEAAIARAKGHVELYVASWHYDRPGQVPADQHNDHKVCVDVGRILAEEGVLVRYAKHYSSRVSGGTRYRPTERHKLLLEGAAAAYQVVGQRSTKGILASLEHGSRVTG